MTGHFKTSQNLVLMRWLHIPRGAVPDVTGLEPSHRLLEVLTEGLTHFLPVGHYALGSLNSGSQVAASGRTMCPATKLPESLYGKEVNVTTAPWMRNDEGLETTWPKTTTSCFLVSCLSGALSSTLRISHHTVQGGPFKSPFPSTSLL